VGVAAMMATINTVTAEYANVRRRDLAVVIQGAGFPLGGALGGVLAYQIADLSWRWVFVGGAALSLVLMAAAAAWLPESIDFLLARRPKHALERLNRLLARLHQPALDRLPDPAVKASGGGVAALSTLAPRTALICAAFFCLMISLYFLNSWTPKLLADYGYSTRAGVSGSIFMNLGGATGNLVFATLTLRWGAGRLSPVFLVACFAAAVAFALAPARIELLTPMAFVLGALLFGSMGSLYAIVPALFPAAVRTTGTGLSLGIGRIGATIGPYVGGVLIAAGWSRAEFGTAMAAPLLLSAAAAWALGRRTDLKV
jgi:MFS family permease